MISFVVVHSNSSWHSIISNSLKVSLHWQSGQQQEVTSYQPHSLVLREDCLTQTLFLSFSIALTDTLSGISIVDADHLTTDIVEPVDFNRFVGSTVVYISCSTVLV